MYVFPAKLSHARSCNLNHILFLKLLHRVLKPKFHKTRLADFSVSFAIKSRRVSKLQSMTNACLGFLLQKLSKKCWEFRLNRGAVNWKPWMSCEKQTQARVTSFLPSKACPALHRKTEGQESAAPQPSWGQQSCRTVLLCSGQPWHHPRQGAEGQLTEHPCDILFITHSRGLSWLGSPVG